MKLNVTKDKIQKEILKKVIKAKGWGILALATGVGKSRIPIMYLQYLESLNYFKAYGKVLIVVPTEKLRDENWKNEFFKWDSSYLWVTYVRRECYVSINKIHDEHFDLVILDEGHNLTENNIKFFQQNAVDRCLLLTATLPKDKVKQDLIASLSLPFIEEITLDQAVEMGLIAPYKVKVILLDLNKTDKYILAGNRTNPFMTTEWSQYQYLTRCVEDARTGDHLTYKMRLLARMRFIYNLKTKTEAARYILNNVIPKKERTLIFAGSIKQAETLNKYYFHSKSNTKHLNMFLEKEVNRLSCVNALNEGMNLNDVDIALVTQLNSKSLNIIQRMGRILRYREGHTGIVYILCVSGTVDDVWTTKALKDFDPENVEYIEFSKLKDERK